MSDHAPPSFLQACQGNGPMRLRVEPPAGVPFCAEFLQPFAVLGSDPKSDLLLDDAYVSPRHAYVQLIGGRVFCVDLGSRTGVHWPRGRKRFGWLRRSAAVRMGPFWLRLPEDASARDPDGDEFNPLATQPLEEGVTPLTLEFYNVNNARATWRVNRPLTLLGSSAFCKVRLESSGVSRVDCSLVCTPGGAWVVDLLGRGELQFNGQRVRQARIRDGDRLKIGSFVVLVREEAPSLPPAAGQPQSLSKRETSLETRTPPTVAPGPTELIPAPPTPGPLPAGLGFLLPGATTAEGALTGPQVLPLISQFGAMQQQMFEQFQQTMMMMFQMFSALHKDQMGFMQDELDRLQQLTGELHTLQRELVKHPPPAALTAPGSPAPVVRPEAGPPAGRAPRDLGAPAAGPAAAPRKAPLPAAPETPPARENGTAPAAAAREGEDIHLWLCQRMAKVQQEQQGLWQRILSFMTGKRAEDAPS